jgi:hypothetical protein
LEAHPIYRGQTLIGFVYNKANAAMVAAAPDLLAAAERVITESHGSNFENLSHAAIDALSAAIAAARGEE